MTQCSRHDNGSEFPCFEMFLMRDLFSAKGWRFGWHCSELMRLIFGFLTGVLPTLGALEWRGRWKGRPRSARGD